MWAIINFRAQLELRSRHQPFYLTMSVKNSAALLISGMTKLSFRKKGAGIVYKVLQEYNGR